MRPTYIFLAVCHAFEYFAEATTYFAKKRKTRRKVELRHIYRYFSMQHMQNTNISCRCQIKQEKYYSFGLQQTFKTKSRTSNEN